MMQSDFGFVRLGAAVPRVYVGDPALNVEEIAHLVQKAATADVQFLAFPELSLTGYTCYALFQSDELHAQIESALRTLLIRTHMLNTAFAVGLPLSVDDQLFNVAAIIHRGDILGLVPKTCLPNYGNHLEPRFFAPSTRLRSAAIHLDAKEVPIGTDLLFDFNNRDGRQLFRLGAEICEDLWGIVPPSSLQAASGANVLINLSASNAEIGKHDYRRSLVTQQSARCLAAYVYAGAGTGESSGDTVYDGPAMICYNGNVIAEAPRYRQDPQLIFRDVDLDVLRNERRRSGSFSQSIATHHRGARIVRSTMPHLKDPKHFTISRNPFVPFDPDTADERCKEVFNIQVTGLRRRIEPMLRANPDMRVVIGVSGGLDSTHALLVTCKTFDDMDIGRDQILGVTMPGPGTTEGTETDAHRLMDQLGIDQMTIPITDAVELHLRTLGHEPCWQCLLCENAQARERTQILMNLGFVIGTGDMSEIALGWMTYNADQQSMYNPNGGVPKTLIRYLIGWVSDSNIFPEASNTLRSVADRPISPELTASDSGEIEQRTEDKIGPFDLNDFITFWVPRHGVGVRKLFFLARHAFVLYGTHDEITILKWMQSFFNRFPNGQFKRENLPSSPKVGTLSLSPRFDWHMAPDINMRGWVDQVDQMITELQTTGRVR